MIDRKTMLTQAVENGFEKTLEGYPDTLKYCKEKNAYDYTIYGNCGKNLFDVNQKMRFRYPSLQTSTIDGDTLTVSNKAYATGGMWRNIPVKAGTYTLSVGSTTNNIYINYFAEPVNTWNFNTMTVGAHVIGSNTKPPVSLPIEATADGYIVVFALFTSASDDNTVTTAVFKNIQVELGETATEYESYKAVGDLNAESGKYILPVTVSGKNLLRYPYSQRTKVINGITFTDNGDGTITANGTATANAIYVLYANYLLDKNETYVLSSGPDGNKTSYVYLSLWKDAKCVAELGTWKNGTYEVINLAPYDYDTLSIQLTVLKGNTVDNLVFKPQLELGETATDYEPYTEPCTTTIYRSDRLKPGESINYENDNLPPLPLFNDTNVITVETEVSPSNISVTYNTKVRGSHE